MMAGGYDRSRDGLATGCCSARAPCSHQQHDPYSLCAVCAEAREVAASERISAAQAVYDEAMADYDPTAPDHEEHAFDAMKAAIARADALQLQPAEASETQEGRS